MNVRAWAASALVGSFAFGVTALKGAEMTLTGAVGDAACGVTHKIPGEPARCTLACVKAGAPFALIVEDTAYTLEVEDDTVRMQLEKLAGRMATITGDVDGETMAVGSVTAAGD